MDNYLMFDGIKYTLVPVADEPATETPAVETTEVTEPTGTQEAVVESNSETA